MDKKYTINDPIIKQALRELEKLIQDRYPTVMFDTFEGDDPCGIYLRATVDIEDTDEVLDVVIDRLYALQVEQGLPIQVVTTIPFTRITKRLRKHLRSHGRSVLPHILQS